MQLKKTLINSDGIKALSSIERQLILTADEHLWQLDWPVLFLGEWCKQNEKQYASADLDAETVSHPWLNFERFSADYGYLTALYERVLPKLCDQLNKLHGTNHSERYWRILIGPWLATFMHIAFERWTVLSTALENWNIGEIKCPILSKDEQIPLTINDLHELAQKDTWAGYLYSMILESKGVAFSKVEGRLKLDHGGKDAKRRYSIIPTLKRIQSRILDIYSRLMTRPSDIFIIGSYVPFEELVKLQVKLGQIPIRHNTVEVEQINVELSRRSWHINIVPQNEFEKFLLDFLPYQMPRIYNEGYQQLLRTVAMRPWPKKPKAIFTSNALWGDEVVMAYTAANVENGAILTYGQHGGLYGVAAFSWAEMHERKIADQYLTWGWTEPDAVNLKKIGYFKRNLVPSGKYNLKGYLTIVCCDFPRYTHRLDSESMKMYTAYTKNNINFALALSPEKREKLLVRLPRTKSQWSQEKRWIEKLPTITIDNGLQSIKSIMENSRLIVYTYNSTGFIEAFVSGIPCILFWDETASRLRESAIPHFNELKNAGILHISLEGAAKHVTNVWDDIPGWWHSKSVQRAVTQFSDKYCSNSRSKYFNLLKHLK
jgi:putative transferase (TIGR04331 family)